MPTEDHILRTLFSEGRKRLTEGKDRTLITHLQLFFRLPVESRNAFFEPLLVQERGERAEDARFELVEELGELVVPTGYKQGQYIDAARARLSVREDVVIVDEWNGGWFRLASHELKEKDKLSVSVVQQLGRKVTLGEQLAFLDVHGAVYPSVHGLLLVLEQLHSRLAPNMWYASLDAEERLSSFEGNRYVLTFIKKETGYLLELQSLSHITDKSVALLCFREKK